MDKQTEITRSYNQWGRENDELTQLYNRITTYFHNLEELKANLIILKNTTRPWPTSVKRSIRTALDRYNLKKSQMTNLIKLFDLKIQIIRTRATLANTSRRGGKTNKRKTRRLVGNARTKERTHPGSNPK